MKVLPIIVAVVLLAYSAEARADVSCRSSKFEILLHEERQVVDLQMLEGMKKYQHLQMIKGMLSPGKYGPRFYSKKLTLRPLRRHVGLVSVIRYHVKFTGSLKGLAPAQVLGCVRFFCGKNFCRIP